MRGGIPGSEIRRAPGVRRVDTRSRKAERHARLVSLGNTAMQRSRPATPASRAAKASTRAPKEPPPSRNATAARRASTRHRRLRLPQLFVTIVTLVLTQRMAAFRNAHCVPGARRQVWVHLCASRVFPDRSWRAVRARRATRGGIPGSEIRRARGVRRVDFKTQKAKHRVRLVSLGSTGMKTSRPATHVSRAGKGSTQAHKVQLLSRNATAARRASTPQRQH